jgi:catechol 2,3-dioxygenase-like lactoylglutathione lyase family enzyme
MRLDTLTLQVPNVARAKIFYTTVLGMTELENNYVGYSETGLKLCFVKCNTSRKATSRDAYWKIGIVVKNLDHAFEYLKQQQYRDEEIECSKPSQFLDIGYLCHLRDPAGLGIELLQQGFEGKHETVDGGRHPIGGQATLAHITIRVSDLEKAKAWCEETMNMRLVSIQNVELYSFTLYFYTWSDEELPNESSLEAVENRAWLWGRPYAMLELQHVGGNGGSSLLRPTAPGEAGPTKILCRSDEKEIEIDCNAELGL